MIQQPGSIIRTYLRTAGSCSYSTKTIPPSKLYALYQKASQNEKHI